jgi:uncharacterized protein
MPTVTVRGSARADVDPDRVRLTVLLSADGADGPEALAGVTSRSAAATEVLDAYELLARRPAGVSVQPRWNDRGEVTGQTAQRLVVVEARADGPLGELLARLVDVPGTTVQGAEWLVDDTNPARSRLREAAVGDALSRAGDYARAAGLRLGALDRIAEPGLGEPIPVGGMARSGAKLAMSLDTDMGGGPVLELEARPVPIFTEIDVRWALLDA